MNKKILAIAALALVATSGLASAQTVRQQPRLEREARIVSPYTANAAVYQADDRIGLNSFDVRRERPGDNDMDPWAAWSR